MTVDFVSDKKRKRIDKTLNLFGVIFLLFSIIGLGSKGGIPSFSILLGKYSLTVILILLLVIITLFLFKTEIYKEGNIVLTEKSIIIKNNKQTKIFLFNDLKEFSISINDIKGYDNFIEFNEDGYNNKLFFAFKKVEHYYQIKEERG